ncbi:phosphotransferase [Actinopolymorpha pittospori]
MRILPDRPSLAFLRKEAKDLLVALRESSPEASLADAQRALASEYGMRDWAALRSEVEQRAEETPTAPVGLADALAGAFGLGRVTESPAPVSYTPTGRSWSIMTDRGRWLACTVYPFITHAQAEVGARLRDAAVAAGVAAPTPVRSPHGRLIEPVQGQNWRVQEWIEAGPAPMIPVPAAVARQAGRTLGTLHSLAIPSASPIDSYLTSRRPEAAWWALLDEARAAHKPWAEQLGEVVPTLLDLRAIEANIEDRELILCNLVLNPENVRMGHDDELVVTEWDVTGSLTPELELGSALTHWALQPSINRPAIAALRDGYVQAAGRWPALDLTSFATAVTGYLNWTYQTICAAMNSADPDHAAFAERESVDLLKRPMTRSSLHELLAAIDG